MRDRVQNTQTRQKSRRVANRADDDILFDGGFDQRSDLIRRGRAPAVPADQKQSRAAVQIRFADGAVGRDGQSADRFDGGFVDGNGLNRSVRKLIDGARQRREFPVGELIRQNKKRGVLHKKSFQRKTAGPNDPRRFYQPLWRFFKRDAVLWGRDFRRAVFFAFWGSP